MKRLTLSIMMTAALALAAFTAANAQGPGRGPGFGFGPGGPGGPGRGAMAVLRGLDLTDDQRTQIKAIREAAREARDTPPAGVPLHRQIQAEIFADVPDTQTLATLQDQLIQAQAAQFAKRLEIEQKIAQVLTPEQRQQVRERLAQAPTRRSRGQDAAGKPGERPAR